MSRLRSISAYCAQATEGEAVVRASRRPVGDEATERRLQEGGAGGRVEGAPGESEHESRTSSDGSSLHTCTHAQADPHACATEYGAPSARVHACAAPRQPRAPAAASSRHRRDASSRNRSQPVTHHTALLCNPQGAGFVAFGLRGSLGGAHASGDRRRGTERALRAGASLTCAPGSRLSPLYAGVPGY